MQRVWSQRQMKRSKARCKPITAKQQQEMHCTLCESRAFIKLCILLFDCLNSEHKLAATFPMTLCQLPNMEARVVLKISLVALYTKWW